MDKTKLRVLITRPEDKARTLATKLAALAQVEQCLIKPLLSFTANPAGQTLTHQLKEQTPEKIIFISVPAVDFAMHYCPPKSWPQESEIFAVGDATAKRLQEHGFKSVLTPVKHDSEGLLQLPPFTSIEQQNILIIRGNGGRELLKEELSRRGANVDYSEVYQRQWPSLSATTAQQWKTQGINCIVITSNEMLIKVNALLEYDHNHWQQNVLLIVASERIQNTAKNLGYQQVINAGGASDQAIYSALSKLG
jgi:uroporphyrinogen-III synthase